MRGSDGAGGKRDMRPALGEPGGPADWRRAVEGAPVAHHLPDFGDARASFLYGDDTAYAAEAPRPAEKRIDHDSHGQFASRAPNGPSPCGPVLKAPVWTWEVPLYFWFGGIAAGASFAGLACDLARDRRSARVARLVALGALGPAPVLLIMDLGRPERFLNMLRVFRPRSPMSMGAWCLSLFGAVGSAAVACDLAGRGRAARRLGGANAVLGAYLGSYTGVLLAATAVPLWARSRLFLGPIFVATATATGAAAVRLALDAAGPFQTRPRRRAPAIVSTRRALARVEAGAMLAELGLASLNERRRGEVGRPLRVGRAGRLFGAAKWCVRGGLALRLAGSRGRSGSGHAVADRAASALFLAAGLAFRYGWVEAGKRSARDVLD